MARTLQIEIVGDPRSYQRALKDSGQSTKRFGSALSSLGKAGVLAAAGGIAAVAIGLKKSVDAAKEAEISQRQMAAGLDALGLNYEAHSKHIDDVIQKQSRLSALDDEDLQNSFTRLARVTHDVNKALEDNALAADIARAKGVSLEAATAIVTKAEFGQVGSLKRQGIEILKVTDAQDKLKEAHGKVTEAQKQAAKAADDAATRQAAIAALQKTFAGQAESYGNSAAGASERFSVALENLQEQIGGAVLPILATLTTKASDFITRMSESQSVKDAIKTIADAIGVAAKTIEKSFDDIAAAAKIAWAKAKTAAQDTTTWYEQNVTPALNNVRDKFREHGEDNKKTMNTWQRNVLSLTTLWGQNLRSVVNTALALLAGDFDKAFGELQGIVKRDLNAVISTLRGLWGTALSAAKGIGLAIVRGIAQGLSTLASDIKKDLSAIGVALGQTVAEAGSLAYGIGRAIVGGIVGGLSGLLGAVKDKIVSGVRGAISAAGSILHGSGPFEFTRQAVGMPLAFGITEGLLLGLGDLPKKMSAKLKETITAGRQAVSDAKSQFESAFGDLASAAFSAFDKATDEWVSPAQKLLDKMDREKTKKDLQDALNSAVADLEAARAGGTPEEIAAAQKAAQEAIIAIQRDGLEQQALLQQANHDRLREQQRVALQGKLTALQTELGQEGAAHTDAHKKIMKLFKQFKIDYADTGKILGAAIVSGLRDSLGDVEKAAADIANIIKKYLKLRSPAEKGPLSDLNHWFDNFADTLLSGVDMRDFAKWSGGAAATAGVGAMSGGAYATGGGDTININVENLYGTDERAVRNLARQLEPHLNRGPASLRTT